MGMDMFKMDHEVKYVIIGGIFTILAVIIGFMLTTFFPSTGHPNLEITQFEIGECGPNNSYTCLNFQVKNTGNEIAIINGVRIKKLNQSIISDSITTSYPRLTENDLPADMYMVRLRTDLDPDLMNQAGLYFGQSMYYPMPPQSSQQFSILLDSDRTAQYNIICIVRSDIGDLKYKPRAKLILENVNTSFSEAKQTLLLFPPE